jgi:hypothetical protein
MTIHIANLDSSSFTFQATGLTEAEAKAALIRGLKTHAKAYRLATNWWKTLECDIVIVESTIGGCTRDREAI